ncbi:Major Facilitator Superfamily [Aspergillus sclerotialis]|uniref:Major Facilitator Superfamily n=1 Tax=Aspergillus sclerotialis TaxID=2070753 RepID=A0A3A2ZPM2_9EURO|nr:Major Facilitator Superfamily [Aspergillus sclerotialis]
MDSIKASKEEKEWTGELPEERAEEKALVRKVDLFLLPSIWLMYLFSYADRTNIGNAKVAGMMADLHLSSQEYSLALVIFFISYVVFEIPSNLILARTRPSIYVPTIMALWGAVTCCMGAVKSSQALLGVRFVIGLLEAGFAPGVMLILSSWYKKEEQAKRFTIFYSAAVLSGAFGGIIAGAITSSLDGRLGIAGWRWLFIVEGAATIACAILGALVLPDFPATSKRFSPRQRQVAVERLTMDNVTARTEDNPPLSAFEAVWSSMIDWRTWLLTIGYMSIGGSATMSYFYPTLVEGLGYKGEMIQYMVVPIYAVAFIVILAAGYFNDKYPKVRGIFIALLLAMSMVCGIIVCAVYNYTARYVLLVFMASGLLSANGLSLAYASSTFAPMQPETRAVSLAFVNALANLSGIYGAYLFPSEDAPKYLMGFGVIAGLSALGVVIYSSAHVLVRRYPVRGTSGRRD